MNRLHVLSGHLTASEPFSSNETVASLATLSNKKIVCSLCSSSAVYCCLATRQYLCAKCSVEQVKKNVGNKHHLFKVAEMKSMVSFEGFKKENESDPRRSWTTAQKGLMTIDKVENKTLLDGFLQSLKKNQNRPLFGRRVLKADGTIGPYVAQSYKEVGARVVNLAAGLASLQLPVGSRVALYSINRAEWIIAEYACYGQNLVTVPLYDTLGPDASEFILKQAEVTTIFCSRDKVASLVKISQSGQVPSLKTIIVFPLQPWDKPTKTPIDFNAGLTIKSLEELERKGKESPVPFRKPRPSDMCTFCYTSGTTGDPKGAMISHGSFALEVVASTQVDGTDLRPDDVHISFLPLAHIMERFIIGMVVNAGARADFYRGDVNLLLEDMQECKPTIFVGVPRLYNRIYDKINGQVAAAGGVSKWLFETGYNAKRSNIYESNEITHWFWDRLVFAKPRNAFGGRMRLAITGSAPISAKVVEFFRITTSAAMLEGYGMTETCAAATCSVFADHMQAGNVGIPLPNWEIKLQDVPDMGYLSTDKTNGVPTPRGEICMRGGSCFSGYFKLDEKTREAIDSEGWLHSGDIGIFLPSGELKIIDRKKNLFKLAQGEYVAPEKIEQIYQHAPSIAQIFVHGDSLQNELVAVVIPDIETVGPWAKANNIPGSTLAEWIKDKRLHAFISDEMEKEGKKAKLRGFESVKSFFLDSELFSVENNLLTPTMKLRRTDVQSKYQERFNAMYKSIEDRDALKKKANPLASKM